MLPSTPRPTNVPQAIPSFTTPWKLPVHVSIPGVSNSKVPCSAPESVVRARLTFVTSTTSPGKTLPSMTIVSVPSETSPRWISTPPGVVRTVSGVIPTGAGGAPAP
jgi:hypothetical protein